MTETLTKAQKAAVEDRGAPFGGGGCRIRQNQGIGRPADGLPLLGPGPG